MMGVVTAELELADWRRKTNQLYAAVRAESAPAAGHRLWIEGRDEMLREHPQSPLLGDDPMRSSGVPYWPYDPSMRFEVEVHAPEAPVELAVPTDGDGVTAMRLAGRVNLAALGATVDVWSLRQYGGGLFIPLRDGTAGDTTYGGGRYALDTAKGADLGGAGMTIVLDLNFLYHPSCRYNYAWQCPLAPAGNTIAAPVQAGERL
jgi:uncharacterized protein (DUF1684 family)